MKKIVIFLNIIVVLAVTALLSITVMKFFHTQFPSVSIGDITVENIINFVLALFIISIVVIVEKVMYKKHPSKKAIDKYQEQLDITDKNANQKYGFNWKHDALIEITKEREQIKSFTLLFSGIGLAFVFVVGMFFYDFSTTNIIILCAEGILLICYGLIRLAESKIVAIIVLLSVFLVGTTCMQLFEKAMSADPYSYFYVCGLILLFGAGTFLRKPQAIKIV